MSNFLKWLSAGVGWAFAGPIGGIIGYALASAFDGFSQKEVEQYQKSRKGKTGTQSGDFEVALLILSAKVITADGKTLQSELDFVRSQFVQMYGAERANQSFKLFKEIVKKGDIPTREVCAQIVHFMDHSSRLQLVHFLFGIANADGHVHQSEIEMIRTISNYLNVSFADFQSIAQMFKSNSVDYFKILEIDKTASDDEVKKAYRKMARKYHPDKVQHLGQEHLAGAKEKFQKVQEAYEKIKKERGF